MTDKYIVKKYDYGKGIFLYYKNDQLHRESGPAIIRDLKDKKTTFGDEHLYEEIILSTSRPQNYPNHKFYNQEINQIVNAKYYLEGIPYHEKKLKQLKELKDLNKELTSELPIIGKNTKKSKI